MFNKWIESLEQYEFGISIKKDSDRTGSIQILYVI